MKRILLIFTVMLLSIPSFAQNLVVNAHTGVALDDAGRKLSPPPIYGIGMGVLLFDDQGLALLNLEGQNAFRVKAEVVDDSGQVAIQNKTLTMNAAKLSLGYHLDSKDLPAVSAAGGLMIGAGLTNDLSTPPLIVGVFVQPEANIPDVLSFFFRVEFNYMLSNQNSTGGQITFGLMKKF